MHLKLNQQHKKSIIFKGAVKVVKIYSLLDVDHVSYYPAVMTNIGMYIVFSSILKF